jgi:hypothetical protein
MKDTTIIILGVISAVVAAFVVAWLNRFSTSPTQSANQTAWNSLLTSCTLPNLNLAPQSPASAYQTGAPVTNYKSFARVGVWEVPTE